MKKRALSAAVAACILSATSATVAQQSVARQWNDLLLEAIRNDQARPPMHGRNLFHTSIAMWDAWAAYDDVADTFLVHERHTADDVQAAREEAISYAVYRILRARFANSPGAVASLASFDLKMSQLGYDPAYFGTVGDTPAAFGNRIAISVLGFGFADGSNEQNDYEENIGYEPINPPLVVDLPGNPDLIYPNRWQPLALEFFIDQSGIQIGEYPGFLGPHWGHVSAFALTPEDRADLPAPWSVYHDPGPPPHLGTSRDQEYKDVFKEVVYYGSLLDPDDGVTIDISPGAIGNNPLGTYDGNGYPLNPYTGLPYAPNIVKRGDYGRCIAEFWADGPDSETPPGHWNVVANDVVDHPLFERRIAGAGDPVDPLEWDVKMYLALNGAVHDAAVTAWGCKGYYDFIRPISAIRYMCQKGQSTVQSNPTYDEEGIPLEPGLIEIITTETTAPGGRHEHLVERIGDFIINDHVGEIAVRAWKEPADPETQYGGVDWILAANWVPYQRPTFVTPPFAGYVSGHSTFSRAAAEVLTGLTGSPYFPGGLGEYTFPANTFLAFEVGPTEPVTVQWATYYDAADEAGISRLYGGIHPRADDLPGRIMGSEVGIDAWQLAQRYFAGRVSCPADLDESRTVDILDLLAFLDGWFQTSEDYNSDGVTDIFDLLGYLNDWFASGGACP